MDILSSEEALIKALPDLDKEALISLCQSIVNQPHLVNNYELVLMEALVDLPLSHLFKLTCLSTLQSQCLAENQQARSILFSYCLRIRHTRQDLDDIELYNALYAVLAQCAPSDLLSWQRELGNQNCEYDMIIENYLLDPSVYPAKVFKKDPHDKCFAFRFSLFNTLFESEMKPIQFEDQRSFSDQWTKIVKYNHASSSRRDFHCSVLVSERGFWESQTRQPKNPPNFDRTSLCIALDKEEFKCVLAECFQSLRVAHIRYFTTIAYSLMQLVVYAQNTFADDKELQSKTSQLSQAVWFEIYQALLDHAAFETAPCDQSPTFLKLFRVAACYMQFKVLPGIPYCAFPMAVWDHFVRQRSILIQSTGISNDLLFIEEVIFTSTGYVSNV